MRILCLDPSLTCTGWALVNYDETTRETVLDSFGTIKAPAKSKTTTITDRALYVIHQLSLLLAHANINLVLREEVIGSKSAAANTALNLIKGALLGMCITLPRQAYTARRTKLCLTGKPDASKNEMIDAVQKKFPTLSACKMLKAEREAVCDALALYITWLEGK